MRAASDFISPLSFFKLKSQIDYAFWQNQFVTRLDGLTHRFRKLKLLTFWALRYNARALVVSG
jgi:hypothetical protein